MENTIYLDIQRHQDYLKSLMDNDNFLSGTITPFTFDSKISTSENLDHLAIYSLQESLSIPILASFKPLYLDLVSRWISNPNIEKEFIRIFGNGLKYNQVIPGSFILTSISQVIKFSNEIFPLLKQFIKDVDFFNLIEKNIKIISNEELKDILLSFYRILKSNTNHNNDVNFIKPDFLYSLLLNHQSTVIRYLSIQLLSIYLKISERATSTMIENHIGRDTQILGELNGDENIDYLFLAYLEAKRQSNASKILKDSEIKLRYTPLSSSSCILISNNDLSPSIAIIGGILIIKFHQPVNFQADLVQTTNSLDTISKLSINIQKSKPTLLAGPPGSGKTFFINEIAKFMSYSNDIVRIHLGDETDAKLLLGTYSSGATPGTFEWKSGVLTTALREGKWVLIEDIDKAPTEVLSILLTLLEKREIRIPSRGEIIKAKDGFQLFSTISLNSNESEKKIIPDLIGLRLWNKIFLNEQSIDELKLIISTKWPRLKLFSNDLITTYSLIRETYESSRFHSLCKGSHLRSISTRDLIKWASRIDKLLLNANYTLLQEPLPQSIFDNIFAEAVDCFVGAVDDHEAIAFLTKEIGESLKIPTSRINLYLENHVPQFEDDKEFLRIGRALLPKPTNSITKFSSSFKKISASNSFATTNHAKRLMEQIGVSLTMIEPTLLVGETGTGKTTIVQQMAELMGKKLTVINVSQQTESSDLLGGYKPVSVKLIAIPLQEEFQSLFDTFPYNKKNEIFSAELSKYFNRNDWKIVIKCWLRFTEIVKRLYNKTLKKNNNDNTNKKKNINEETPSKKRRLDLDEVSTLLDAWTKFEEKVKIFEIQFSQIENSFVFKFVEGTLVKAVRNGDWLLLDEINLASQDTLESISDLLSSELNQRSILLSEKGEIESVKAHPDFRIFGCMNPATDVGKRDLPIGIRSRFTEYYVVSPDTDLSDLNKIISQYLPKDSRDSFLVVNDIANLYIESKKKAEGKYIVDGAKNKPHFSIRTLSRTLSYARSISAHYGLRRSLYEGFCMTFLTLLDGKSESILLPLIEEYTINRSSNPKSDLSRKPRKPNDDYTVVENYLIKKGSYSLKESNYVTDTPFVRKNLRNLIRASSTSQKYPILIQGPTSSGKTSMIKHLADITGHKFIRINNHEHTDLQEYLGSYIADSTGSLVFKEGALVEALRNGYWVVLDELNLAPTDVLESLNRLLDDNRQLFIPETGENISPHPDFLLFATQNPPELYGGRKVLSRAFRNRFLELHFDDIPVDELETILAKRCQNLAPSYATKIVQVYKELSVQRQETRYMEQKNSFATLRDLFRWAQRDADDKEQIAANGYMLLAERVRKPEEKMVVKTVIEKVMKVKLDIDKIYERLENKELFKLENCPVIWTKGMRRLSTLVLAAIANNEPVLLVGETGCGKTTICQILAGLKNKNLISLNVHQNTETGDILGAQRPVRARLELQKVLEQDLILALEQSGVNEISDDVTLEMLLEMFKNIPNLDHITPDLLEKIKVNKAASEVLFEWNDGPLIHALKQGDFFLMDEISLGEDSVLERLNSVLETERTLFLAEKGDNTIVTAKEGFQFFATMNPGGDYGKKELSPALRNRFTEIWVPSMDDFADVKEIVHSKLSDDVKHFDGSIISFSEWFGKKFGGGNATSGIISLRDILAWVNFINASYKKMSPKLALLHGCSMVFIDALGTNNTAHFAESQSRLEELKNESINKLVVEHNISLEDFYNESYKVSADQNYLKIGPFSIARKNNSKDLVSFNLNAPTTAANAMRVIRAMQVNKPILLEGSPGVGKTSLISAIADATGQPLTRINLSDQTDLIDLFGSDSPAEGGKAGEFVWRDAPFLRAMQQGEWVLLDEMNLASQSVLEGLNACLDHRGEVYIPELDRSFSCHPNFLVFAAQNPQIQGGGRKGLPKSFVNRFTTVYAYKYLSKDLELICHQLFPKMDDEIITKLIRYILKLEDETIVNKKWGSHGGPWEFNLRDTLRWLELLNKRGLSEGRGISEFLGPIISQRFRSKIDRQMSLQLFSNCVGEEIQHKDDFFQLTPEVVQVGRELIARNEFEDINYALHPELMALQCNTPIIETALTSINNNWPLILVGPTCSGKTSIVRYLASILGVKLDEFPMNSDIDSMDIIGGYEQVDLIREISQFYATFSPYIKRILVTLFKSTSPSIIEITYKIISVLRQYETLDPSVENFEIIFETTMELLTNDIFVTDSQPFKDELLRLQEEVIKVRDVKFKWFDGILVRALIQGHWLILDNANLCNSSVLDRLNSLLEPNGVLTINEYSLHDGSPRVVIPHPNFRLFLTVDPKYGELSRAMRNRGIEIFLDSLESRQTNFDKCVLDLAPKSNDPASDLVIKIEELSLGEEETKMAKPLVTFLDPCDSFSHNFSLVNDIYENVNDKSNSKILQTISTTLPLFTSKDVHRWASSSLGSRLFDADTKAMIKEVTETIKFFQEKSILDYFYNRFMSASKPVADAIGESFVNDYCYNQGLNHTINDYFSRFMRSSPDEHFEIHYFLDLILNIREADKFLEVVYNKSTTKKAQDLNFVQKCAAVYHGRQLKNSPKINIYSVILGINDYIKNELETSLNSGSVFDLSSKFRNLHALQLIWNDIVKVDTIKNGVLHVYQQLLQTWIDESVETYSTNNINILIKAVSELGDELNLTTGTSMTIIWNNFRVTYPSSEEAWSQHEHFVQLINKFDKLVERQFPDSLDLISSMRKSIFQINRDMTKENFVQVSINTLSEVIENLEKESKSFKHVRENTFKNLFLIIFNFLLAKASNKDSFSFKLDEILNLGYFSGKSTLSMEPFNNNEFLKPFPLVLEYLWENTNDGYYSFVSDIFSTKFLKDSFQKALLFEKTAANSLVQSSSDLKSFSIALIRFSESILQDQTGLFKTMLIDWISSIIEVHIEDPKVDDTLKLEIYSRLVSNDPSIIMSIPQLLTNSVDEKFLSVLVTFILPALGGLLNHQNSPNYILALGRAFVSFSLGLIQLYVPNIPFDPAIREHVIYERLLHQKDLAQDIMNSWSAYYAATHRLSPKLSSPWSTDIVCIKPQIYRANTTETGALFDEWDAIMKASIGLPAIQSLLEAAEDFDGISLQRIKNFQLNTSQFIKRTSFRFSRQSDLTKILEGYINSLKLGFDLIVLGNKQMTSKYKFHSLWSTDLQVVTIIQKFQLEFNGVCEYCKTMNIDSLIADKVMIFSIKVCLLHWQKEGTFGDYEKMICAFAFKSLHTRWYGRKERSENEVTKDSIYKNKTYDREDWDEDFKLLFPDFSEVTQLSDSSDSKFNEEDVYSQLYSLYTDILSDSNGIVLEDVLRDGMELQETFTDECLAGVNTPTVFASLLSSLLSSIQKYENNQINMDNYNFYQDSHPSETKKSISLVQKIRQFVMKLISDNEWHENAILSNIVESCREFLDYPSNVPLPRLLQKVEQIYTFISQWEKYAHKGVSLSAYFDEITGLIVSWRKLELSTWKSLFRFEDQTVQKGVGKWWFHLYEVIILPIVSGETIVEKLSNEKLVQTLNIFLSKSTYGDFKPKLKLLKSFIVHLEKLLYLDNILDSEKLLNSYRRVLKNVISFYEQFAPIITNKIESETKTYSKQINEIILMASWKDINIDALKASARRSHHNLYKIVRKYRSMLSESITSLIEGGISDFQLTPPALKTISYTSSIVLEYLNDADIVSKVPSWVNRPKILRNMNRIMSNMTIYISNIDSDNFLDLLDFTSALIDDMDQLKKDTPTTLTKENKKMISSLRTQKQRLLTDTLKELKRAGLKSGLTAKMYDSQSSVSKILANMASTMRTNLEDTDIYFNRVLDLLPKLRASVASTNSDVPVSDIQRGAANAEDLLFTLISNRYIMTSVSENLSNFESSLSSFTVLQNNPGELINAVSHENIDMISRKDSKLKLIISWIPYVLDYATSSYNNITELVNLKSNEFDDIVQGVRSEFLDLSQTYFQVSENIKNGIYNSELIALYDQAELCLLKFKSSMKKWMEKNSELSFIGNIILDWLTTLDETNILQNDSTIHANSTEKISLEQLDFSLRDISNYILVSIQKILEKIQSEEKNELTDDADPWFTESQKRFAMYGKYTNLTNMKITAKIKESLKIISLLQLNSEESSTVKDMIRYTLPLLQKYQSLVLIVLNKMKLSYYNNSKSAYLMSKALLNIANNGFCTPEPPSHEKDSSATKDGTGLGDGEGEKNSTDDIEQDDDLTEEAQKPNDEKNKDDKDEDQDDNAVEIEGDMAGDLEDESVKEDEEDGDDNEDENEDEDLDEEIDNLDDLDPNAVDEKMWDEEAQDDSKEKDSNNIPDNGLEQDNMEGNDEGDNSKQKDNQEGTNEQEEQENEEDEDGSQDEEEGLDEQDDAVQNKEDMMDPYVPEVDTLDLPDDMDLENDGSDNENDNPDDDNDDPMDIEPETDAMDIEEDNNIGEPEGDEDEVIEENNIDENQEQNEESKEDDTLDGEENENEQNRTEQEDLDEPMDNPDLEPEQKQESMKDNEQLQAEMEGLQGTDDVDNDDTNDENQDVRQQTGKQGEGADVEVNEEQENGDTNGGSAQTSENINKTDNNEDEIQDPAREKAKEYLKQLGDALEEFHKRHQEIKESIENEENNENNVDVADEYQHTDTNHDTQALGAADQDQIQNIDESMAIEDEEEPETVEESTELKNESIENDINQSEDEEVNEAGEFGGQAQGGIIGEKKDALEHEDGQGIKKEIEELDEEMYEDSADEVFESNKNPRTIEEDREIARKCDQSTQELCAGLCEQLRLILEPTLATKLRGDYKTGKRLNMRRIISYIASGFRKDNIWLRRTKPSKRQYQIMIAIDNSKSMAESRCVDLAFKSIWLVSKALTQLEAGQLSLVKFGETTKVIHPFMKPFNFEAGFNAFRMLEFSDVKTDVKTLLTKSIDLFREARSDGPSDLWQLEIILSDGMCEDHETLTRLVRQAREERIMLVFVIIDGITTNESILDMKEASYDINPSTGLPALKITKYLDSFPFELYVIVKDIRELPDVLSSVLRQYFSELASS